MFRMDSKEDQTELKAGTHKARLLSAGSAQRGVVQLLRHPKGHGLVLAAAQVQRANQRRMLHKDRKPEAQTSPQVARDIITTSSAQVCIKLSAYPEGKVGLSSPRGKTRSTRCGSATNKHPTQESWQPDHTTPPTDALDHCPGSGPAGGRTLSGKPNPTNCDLRQAVIGDAPRRIFLAVTTLTRRALERVATLISYSEQNASILGRAPTSRAKASQASSSAEETCTSGRSSIKRSLTFYLDAKIFF